MKPAKNPSKRRPPGRALGRKPAPASTFPIIGIGASAGGLEALDLFLRNVPAESSSSFVVVQHMDPTHKGLLTELLGRVSRLPVVQVAETPAADAETPVR